MNQYVIKNHYAHRGVPVSFAWGAYTTDMFLVGVLSIGKPCSQFLCSGIAGEENADRVYELNRLCMDDMCPKNSESRFIGWVLRELKKKRPPLIIVSYADTEQNHLGGIYQATNFLYTGITKERTDIDTGDKHSRHYDKGTVDYSKRKKRWSKYRYVYVFNEKDRKALKYKILPYPKINVQQN